MCHGLELDPQARSSLSLMTMRRRMDALEHLIRSQDGNDRREKDVGLEMAERSKIRRPTAAR